MDVNAEADSLAQKIRHCIITHSGRTEQQATLQEFYQAFVAVLREEVMVNWTATINTMMAKKPRILNFLSMEYLPGRMLNNNIANLGAGEIVKATLAKMNRSYADLVQCEHDAGLGNGGLGRLSSCFLDSLATLHYPARAYGLRYQYGIFEQEIWDAKQVERPDCWLLNQDPWESRNDLFATTVSFRGKPIASVNGRSEEIHLLEDAEEVRALPYDRPVIGYSDANHNTVLTLRLWSTKESPRNFELQSFNAGLLDRASENTCLTDVLYPNDLSPLGRRLRLKQEFLLVSASLKDIVRRHLNAHQTLENFGDQMRIQLNDTHPALAIAELMRVLTKDHGISWKDAWETTQACCSYTNHTILKEALEEWDGRLLQELLPRQFLIIQKLNHEFCTLIRKRNPHDEERVRRMSIIEHGRVRMAHLALYGCHKINGVAKLHSELLKTSVFPDFYELYPEKFTNVTNGVTHRRWLASCNPLLADFITARIGRGWLGNFSEIKRLHESAHDPESQKELLRIKHANKERLIKILAQENALRDARGAVIGHSPLLSAEALFDVQIKRIHEYKRQLLNALHLIMIYQELLDTPTSPRVPRMALIGGKAAPGYEKAKHIIQLICCMARTINRNPSTRSKLCIAFIENYNVSKAELLIPAADLSEQISAAGWEASGTGNMKLSMNGALTIGTEDGANIEMHAAATDAWWPFSFGASAQENAYAASYKGLDIYRQNPRIQKALDALKDGTFSENASEAAAFAELHQNLLEQDRFFVLRDLPSYFDTQKQVEELYRQPLRWAETVLHNIAAMGSFTTDESIRSYASGIWGIEPCPVDPAILQQVQNEYSTHDRCHIGK